MHEPVLRFCYLDYLCVAPDRSSRGIGSALYERIREEAKTTASQGLYFECWPDDPELLHDPQELAQAVQRLRFYERLGARPILGTHWDEPAGDGSPLTHLMYDDLGSAQPLRKSQLRKVMHALLERRYQSSVEPSQIERYLKSIRTDPVELRPLRYSKVQPPAPRPAKNQIPLFVCHGHEEHRVSDPGYYESPARLSAILPALQKSGLFIEHAGRIYSDAFLRAVHKKEYLDFLNGIAQGRFLPLTRPEVFPPRHLKLPPQSVAAQIGWFCTDSFTPLEPKAIGAARRAVDVTLSATQAVVEGAPLAYALVRPPGHHAESASLGGYCFYSNAAIAANFARRSAARVAILDLDYHHGNGQQEIFYRRADVLTVSVHADPHTSYPFFSGFSEERGSGDGLDFNLNLPLPLELEPNSWFKHGLAPALERLKEFQPELLVVALGLDTAAGDPTGSWTLRAEHFKKIGSELGELILPTVVVQEGGYRTRTLGTNAVAFFSGFAHGRRLT
jgi:acetoin utilization deacetylase AcuC-like enzyme